MKKTEIIRIMKKTELRQIIKEIISEGKFKKGDVVIPKIGPHKGEKHKIIAVLDSVDGKEERYNIQPIGKSPSKTKYRLGAASAIANQLDGI